MWITQRGNRSVRIRMQQTCELKNARRTAIRETIMFP